MPIITALRRDWSRLYWPTTMLLNWHHWAPLLRLLW